MSKRSERREARWQELRERTNDAAGNLYVATARYTTAEHSGVGRDITAASKALAAAERSYARARSALAAFVASTISDRTDGGSR